MAFFKHVGEHNGKKVIIVQRQLPGEDHMAGVIYSEIIPSRFHDDIMKVLESPEGQQSNDFARVLRSRYFANGDNMMEGLSAEGYIKKAACNAVIVKPNSKSAVRLDELNRLLGEIASGRIAEEQIATTAPEVAESGLTTTEPVAAPAAATTDTNALMMEMMKTMQSMQEEIASLKASTTKTRKTKTA